MQVTVVHSKTVQTYTHEIIGAVLSLARAKTALALFTLRAITLRLLDTFKNRNCECYSFHKVIALLDGQRAVLAFTGA